MNNIKDYLEALKDYWGTTTNQTLALMSGVTDNAILITKIPSTGLMNLPLVLPGAVKERLYSDFLKAGFSKQDAKDASIGVVEFLETNDCSLAIDEPCVMFHDEVQFGVITVAITATAIH